MALGNYFLLLHSVTEFIRATNLEKQVVKRKQQNILFCLDGVNWSHIIAGNVTRLSSCQGARFPPISFPGGEKKKRKGSEYVDRFSVLQSQTRCSGSTWLPSSHSTTWFFQTLTQLSVRVKCVQSTLVGRGVQPCLSSLALFAGRNINNLRYADDTTLMAESEEELKSLLMKVKEESERIGLKLNIQKT